MAGVAGLLMVSISLGTGEDLGERGAGIKTCVFSDFCSFGVDGPFGVDGEGDFLPSLSKLKELKSRWTLECLRGIVMYPYNLAS